MLADLGGKMTKQVMIQGTSSGVGKSIITTGLCRLLVQDGLRVGTFKSQNMTNNGYVLENGKEMAKTQWIAGLACSTEPCVEMNPILLKFGENGVETLLNGESLGVMNLEKFENFKKNAWNEILDSYKFLCNKYEAMVIEGAGSPVEINLRDRDLVNMNLAKKINSPVILVVDIDRGGAFAYAKGTIDLLREDERKLVKGIIINKCKGNIASFKEVATIMEEVTGVKVLGTVPYKPIDIEDEDSLIDSEYGVKGAKTISHMNEQFDILAKHLRENLDIQYLYKILNGEV